MKTDKQKTDAELAAEYLRELKSRSKSDDRTTVRKYPKPVEKDGRTYDHEVRFQCGCVYAVNAQEDLPQLIEALKSGDPK